jgi:hypothetical protein
MKKSEYNKVLKRGCGYEASSGEDTDGDCGHGYEWDCDHCPIVLEQDDSTEEVIKDGMV